MMTTATSTLMQRFDGALAIDTHSVTKSYGKTNALDGLELTVPEGAVYLLVGQNGAGKTTTLRMVLDLARPDTGRISVFGLSPDTAGARIRSSIGYVPEDRGPVYAWMRIGDLIAHHATYYARWDADYASHLVDALGIDLSPKYGTLSKGEARRVQLVMALAHRPRLLLLDEPTDGLDPLTRDRFFELLADHLASSPTTMLISSHLVYEQELFADRLGVLTNGRMTSQVDRDKLDRYMRRYVAEVPADGIGDAGLRSAIVTRHGQTGGIDWVMWGEEADVTSALESAGAKVRHVKRLTLTEAARSLMAAAENESDGLQSFDREDAGADARTAGNYTEGDA